MKKLLVLLFCIISIPLCGATYYCSTTGNDSTGTGSIDNPWRSPVYSASRLTSSGDILIIRAGTYNIVTSPASMKSAAIAPRAANCTIKAYSGETVILQGSNTGNYGVSPTQGVIGNYAAGGSMQNAITIDGFTIKGIVSLEGGSNHVLKNCDISVGGDSWSGIGFGDVLWIEAVTGATIQNNKIHDNIEIAGSGNSPLIMVYSSNSCIFENNNIYNACYWGLYLKNSNTNNIVRYNYFYNNSRAGFHTASGGSSSTTNVYQNIFVGNNTAHATGETGEGGISLNANHTGINIYNNTFYNNYYSDIKKNLYDSTVTFSSWNNIHYNAQTYKIAFPNGATSLGASLLYCNYNNYYGTGAWIKNGTTYSSLATWAAAAVTNGVSGAEAHSVATDPGFLNGSGHFNTPTDFKRSSYMANGRGGSYSTVMGAYITGTEEIGVTMSTLNDTQAPSAPQGVQIQIVQ